MRISYNTLAGDRGTHVSAHIFDQSPSHGRSVEVSVWVPRHALPAAHREACRSAVVQLLQDAADLVRGSPAPLAEE